MPKCLSVIALLGAVLGSQGSLSAVFDRLEEAQRVLIPKAETGVDAFLEKHPDFDGRGVVIAIFDTGVDPAALGLQTTTTGERKIVDMIDGSGAGDVDTSKEVEWPAEPDEAGKRIVEGLSGRPLILPEGMEVPSGKVRLGVKRGEELFHRAVWSRVREARSRDWNRVLTAIQIDRHRERVLADEAGRRMFANKDRGDLSLEDQDKLLSEELLEQLEKSYLKDDPGPLYDCVVWFDGTDYRVVVDTNEDGDLRDEVILRPFGVAGEYGRFADPISATFGVQVYDAGRLLSIVTVSGSHGTHVAAIAAAHFPEQPHRNGIAPGARILSIRMGDVRTGGSSNYFGETRAVASAARHGVDIMNASWGGSSSFQDGSNLSARLYNKLVREYGVTAFVSAGNNGPALSTLGSPGGEAARVIGVGAYVSPDMGRYLYALSRESPETAFGFSSRGPARTGDLGVDIVAPGGAVASLATDSLRASELYNGTSMSAPSAAGVGALLISASKQLGLPVTPERIKAALVNSARTVEEDPFSEGAGMIQALPALAFLQERAREAAWDVFYELSSPAGTFRGGAGLYLRERLSVDELSFLISVESQLSERLPDAERYVFERDVVLSASQDWIEVPDYLRLAQGAARFRPTVHLKDLEPGRVHFGVIRGTLAEDPDGPALFTFPITVIPPLPLSHPEALRHEAQIELSAGGTERIFLEAPAGADRLTLTLRKPEDRTDVPRRFVVNVLSLSADQDFNERNTTEYVWLKSGEEKIIHADVHPGQVVEITVNQYWSTPGDFELSLKAEFEGLRAPRNAVVFPKNRSIVPLRLQPLRTYAVEVKAEVQAGVLAFYPAKTERFPGDERMAFPETLRRAGNLRPERLRQTFEFSLEAPAKFSIGPGEYFDEFQDYGGEFYTVVHERSGLLHQGGRHRVSVDAPKGKITVHREILAYEAGFLDLAEKRPLHVEVEAKLGSLKVFPDEPSIPRGQSGSALTLPAGRHQTLWLESALAAKIADLKFKPDYLLGELSVTGPGEMLLAKVPLFIQPGDDPAKITNPAPKPDASKPEMTAVETFEKQQRDAVIAFIRAQEKAIDLEIVATRDRLLEEWLAREPERAEWYLLRARVAGFRAGVFPESMGRLAEPKDDAASSESGPVNAEESISREGSVSADVDVPSVEDVTPESQPDAGSMANEAAGASVRADLVLARELSTPDEVARYFGAPPVALDGDLEGRKTLAAEREVREAQRALIRESWLLETALAVAASDPDRFRQAFAELKRWGGDSGAEAGSLLRDYYRSQGWFALALEGLNRALGEKPGDSKLRQERIALYRELGWDRFADRDELLRKLSSLDPLNLL